MPRWIGLLGSWALLVLGIGLVAFAAAGEVINYRDSKQLLRYDTIDRLIAEHSARQVTELRGSMTSRAAGFDALQSEVAGADKAIDDLQDTDQTIVISTTENKLYLTRSGQKIFDTIVSTGKGATKLDGRTVVFDTPIGKLKVISKETNPLWVPPDWHYVEEAKKSGKRLVKLNYGQTIDADTGGGVTAAREAGVWDWVGESSSGTRRTLKVKGKNVVEVVNGVERELPPGELIFAGGALIVPPVGTRQRQFDKVLGAYRLNLGDGYAIHGTQLLQQLGQSVSHGCVRVGDADLEKLYNMTNVGDEVIIY
ncbi:MAG TPA: L,D-transpeptidase [Thermoanaerobaculia bacterium]|nr:L,D-transpeptidase [Thermoanaerobaculia bacterium]